MRTTITLDDDVATQLQELSHRTRKPFKVVLNEVVRKGLGGADAKTFTPFRVKPFNIGLRPGIDEMRLNQLVDELELDEAVQKL